MRADISVNRYGWLYRLDYKKLLVIIFLLRLILACSYDIFVNITDKDILLPDSKFYSLRGRYIDLLLQGYDKTSLTDDLLPRDRVSREIFVDTWQQAEGALPARIDESANYGYIVGILYLVFGYYTIWVRVFNICVSILSVYFFFKVAKRHFGDLTANLFLLTALFLPPQIIYSITLSRDFIRVLIISIIVWVAYNLRGLWPRKLKV